MGHRSGHGSDRDAFWEMKEKGEAYKQPAHYEEIHMPKNSGAGIVNNPGRYDADEAGDRHPPDMPDHGETKYRSEGGNATSLSFLRFTSVTPSGK
jgi:hypothetical protein